MKKFVTVLLVAILAVSCIFVLAACKKDDPTDPDAVLENKDGSIYVLGGQCPGWGPGEGQSITDDEFKPRYMKAISLGDERIASIKDKLTGVKYLYALEWTYVASDPVENWTYNPDGEGDQEFDKNLSVKIIKFKDTDGVWAGTYYSSPEAGAATRVLTPQTVWMPQYVESPANGSSGWNSNGVLLGGFGKYLIVFAEFENDFGIAAIKLA